MKRIIVVLIYLILPTFASAESSTTSEITMSAVDALKLAGAFVEREDFNSAEQILTKMPPLDNGVLEVERWFLMGRISAFRGDFDTAIKIYRRILDAQPNLARVRFELAVCYTKLGQWWRADYHLRLAMAGDDLPDEVKNIMNYFRYFVRQNKNWNAWFSFGAAPDNNINSAAGGEECVMTIFGLMCRQLPEPERAIGYNFVLGGNYEFKLSDQWRWKSEGNIYTNAYDKSKYDDLYLSASTGPRYVWKYGDVWLAGIAARRWYGWEGYNWSTGAKIDINYDFSRKLLGGLSLLASKNIYDNFSEYMDGETYGANARLTYYIDADMYIILRSGLDREITIDLIYSNWRPSVGAGFGIELPARFSVYFDTNFYWQDYDGQRWIVKDNSFSQVAEHNFTHRYAVSVSNSKFRVWDFAPMLTFSYTRRDSNIWQREYDKWAIEFSMQQRF
ncbi:MAG: surface lipoprotein assembly modifier [Rickettsiales bacterium]|jgi:hypothetical protein|nr:surface lipoprotein assembly modifier [Rickettsiales bacterium]